MRLSQEPVQQSRGLRQKGIVDQITHGRLAWELDLDLQAILEARTLKALVKMRMQQPARRMPSWRVCAGCYQLPWLEHTCLAMHG